MKDNTILVLGGRGMVGSAILRQLNKDGYTNVLAPSREELDLLNQEKVNDYFYCYTPEVVLNAAAKVGGIRANNTYRGEFIYNNLQIQSNVM